MISKHNFVYSRSSAARILGVESRDIVKFEVWWKVCFVQVRGCRPTFVSKKVFRQHFVDWRIERSRSLEVIQFHREHFRVANYKKGTAYSVYLFEDGLDCTCHDYKNQILNFGGGRSCCKHIYAVLSYMGYNRLSDYVKANAVGAC